jgi:hypothetical protein
MRKIKNASILLMFSLFCCAASAQIQEQFNSKKEIETKVLTYRVADTIWNQDLGNHRAEISVNSIGKAVHVLLPWRRRDVNSDQKRLIVTDKQGNEMKNIYRININRESGEFVFKPESGAGTYFVYYMPFKGKKGIGSFEGDYLKPETAPEQTWVTKNNLFVPLNLAKSKLVEAKLIQFQSRTTFDSFYPMEVCATVSEVNELTNSGNDSYLLFPEDRKYPIRMNSDLPHRWVQNKPSSQFKGTAKRNEYYAFQIGVYAAKEKLENLKVSYSNYQDKITCFNLGGIDFEGKPFVKRVDVPKGKVQALWFGIDIPEDAPAGEYLVDVTIQPENEKQQKVTISLQIEDEVLADRGDSEPWRHSRLRWLNSTMGINDDVVAPYKALSVKYKTISCLMRSIRLNDKGLIDSMISKENPVLNNPMQFIVETDSGIEKLLAKSMRFTKKADGVVSWIAEASSANVSLTINGSMEFDGHIGYAMKVKALKDLHIKDVRLEMPVKKKIAQYFMGMGLDGDNCPENYDWKWKGPQDSYWIGSVNAGFHCEMQGASYSGPLLNLYHPKPPASWYNQNKGGFKISSSANEIVTTSYSGEYQLVVNQELNFEFALLITPVKELNTNDQFINRYYHNGNLPAPKMEDLKSGIKVTNVHHANPVNPYINYPFVAVDTMKNFVKKWHENGLKVKIYYTIRELTNQVAEIWALRSLGNEILGEGSGGGYPWLQEHYVDNYNVQWFTPITGYETCDAAVITSGQSRWYNYYIEGLNWLVKNVDIDGLYLDDVSFDRSMLKRMRKVMDAAKPGCLLDLHSNTGFSKGPANQYTEYFPYINKLWFGESFIYDKMPAENWMVEVSGIPFGLMGDMLHGGGNPWRGMVYGMTVRYPWYTEGVNCDPREIWKIWDSFGIADAKMVGYWDSLCPVKTDNANVLATAYVKNGKVLIALASWHPSKTDVRLTIDWKALGINPEKTTLNAPEIKGFQISKKYGINESVTVEPNKGWLIIIEPLK